MKNFKRSIIALVCLLLLFGNLFIPVSAYTCGYHSTTTLSWSGPATSFLSTYSHCNGTTVRHDLYTCPLSGCSYWIKIYIDSFPNTVDPKTHPGWILGGQGIQCTSCGYERVMPE
jgi:hypothetical protein